MKIQERNEEINNMLAIFKAKHEKYFPPARSLTDEEWETCIDDFFYTTEQWKGTHLQDLAGEISMAFQNDIARVHKAWRKKEGGTHEVQNTKQE